MMIVIVQLAALLLTLYGQKPETRFMSYSGVDPTSRFGADSAEHGRRYKFHLSVFTVKPNTSTPCQRLI